MVLVKRVVLNMKLVIDFSIEDVRALGLVMVLVLDGKKGEVLLEDV